MQHCCDEMASHLASGDVAIRFLASFREYGIACTGSEHPVQLMRFCPWCGGHLPDSLREVWFEKIEEMGLEPGDPRIPSAYASEAWYASAGLNESG
jgi:hypothetical protein